MSCAQRQLETYATQVLLPLCLKLRGVWLGVLKVKVIVSPVVQQKEEFRANPDSLGRPVQAWLPRPASPSQLLREEGLWVRADKELELLPSSQGLANAEREVGGWLPYWLPAHPEEQIPSPFPELWNLPEIHP